MIAVATMRERDNTVKIGGDLQALADGGEAASLGALVGSYIGGR
jgi:hypothetical protein